jgi:hypothetical protein
VVPDVFSVKEGGNGLTPLEGELNFETRKYTFERILNSHFPIKHGSKMGRHMYSLLFFSHSVYSGWQQHGTVVAQLYARQRCAQKLLLVEKRHGAQQLRTVLAELHARLQATQPTPGASPHLPLALIITCSGRVASPP